VSVKATLDSDCDVFEFAMVKLSVVVPFNGMVDAPKAFVIDGGATTVIGAVLLARPVPPLVEPTAPVVFVNAPAVVPVTFSETVHGPLVPIEPPLKLTDVAPATGENVPPQLFTAPGGVATTRPVGKLSVKPTPVSDIEFGLLRVKVSEVEPFSGMLDAPKAFEIVGGPITVSVAVLLTGPVPASNVLTPEAVLLKLPAVVPVTVTEMLHD